MSDLSAVAKLLRVSWLRLFIHVETGRLVGSLLMSHGDNPVHDQMQLGQNVALFQNFY